MTRLRSLTRTTFRSLRARNYRLFLAGQVVSLTGTWVQTVAQAWLVLQLTGSGVAVGVATALQFLPLLVAGPWGGVVADRVDKRRALVAAATAMAVVSAVLAVVTATGVVRLWMVFVLALLMGCATVVEMPTRQAFVIEMVGPEEVANAVGLNSAAFNAARTVGPAVAGVLIVSVGIWPCFLVNTVTFAAVIAALVAMRPDELFRAPPVARGQGQVRAGLRYVWGSTTLRSTLLLVAVVGTFGLNFTVVLPLMARFAFQGGARELGLLSSVMGAGSLVGALVTAARGRPSPRVLGGSCAAFGVLTLAAAAAPTLAWEVGVLPLLGAATITFMATANSMLQLGSSPAMRGRVMALYALVFLGSTPIGGPIVGWVSEAFGPRAGLGLAGVTAVAAAGVAATRLQRRGRGRGRPVADDTAAAEPAAA